jgi:exodeoxyribonuclease V gamma subunit
MHLFVAGSLEPLADRLADVLAEPLADPFAPEVVVVPADGVRRWLTSRLAQRLGATAPGAADGVVANVEFLFPATLVRRALGEGSGLGAWSVGPLAWAVHDALVGDPDHFGQSPDAVRARAIADLFDRYAMYRPQMVHAWARGRDVDGVGRQLAEHDLWQPRLWRAVRQQLGGVSDAERLADVVAELRASGTVAGQPVRDVLPERVVLFGLASLPGPQLDVLGAVAAHVDVHVLAPTVSPERWSLLQRSLAADDEAPRPLPRAEDVFASRGSHPLVSGWGRSSREAHLLLLDALSTARSAGTAVGVVPPAPPAALDAEPFLLARVQHDLAADVAPPGMIGGEASPAPIPFDPTVDRSVTWHRCHGAGRQVEVLRDAIVHLLQEHDGGEARFEPRDIVILCPDVARFAPLVEASFAGDPEHGIPAIPVRVADRTLRQDATLLDTVGAVLDLLDGRFRASQVLGLLSRGPVRRRFGLDESDLDRVAAWVDATNVRWGLGADDHEAFGLPGDLGAHTWRAGLDQLLLGVAMAGGGARIGPGGVVPYDDVEGDDVVTAGRLAEFVAVLDAAVDALRVAATVDRWTATLAASVRALCDLPDDDAWQWGLLERTLGAFAAEATVDGEPRSSEVDPFDLAVLLQARLSAGGGRPRFGTGAVTLSAFTALRGVPHEVVCVLGLDADTGAGAIAAAEDLTADPPCVGDREPRSEQRAQLLDAVLAARQRLVLVSTGMDVRTNEELPPAVPLAELLDVIDATAHLASGKPARTAITVEHPRQAWSPRNFRPGELCPSTAWSFDRSAHDAAGRAARPARPAIGGYLAEPLLPPEPREPVTVDDLLDVCRNPAKFFLTRRLGVYLDKPDDQRDDHIPLTLDALGRWRVANELLEHRRQQGSDWDEGHEARWAEAMRRRGAVPPRTFGEGALDTAVALVDAIHGAVTTLVPEPLDGVEPISVDLPVATPRGLVQVSGSVPEVVVGPAGGTVAKITTSSIKDCDVLTAWVSVAVLTLHDPSTTWRAVTVGRDGTTDATWFVLELRGPQHAAEVLDVVLDLHHRCWCDAVPAMPSTTRGLRTGGVAAARRAYEITAPGRGEAADRFVAELFGDDFESLLALTRRDDEAGDGCADHEGRLAFWAERLWGTLMATALLTTSDDPVPAKDAAR